MGNLALRNQAVRFLHIPFNSYHENSIITMNTNYPQGIYNKCYAHL